MTTDDLQIGNAAPGQVLEQEKKLNLVDSAKPYDSGLEILSRMKDLRELKADETIYGVSDKSNQGMISGFFDKLFVDNRKVTLKEKSYFFHMLAVMVDAGIPIIQSVKTIAGRVRNQRFQRVLNTIVYNAEHGLTISEAMSRFDDIFDDSELGIMRAGEATGKLDEMLFKLSGRLDKRSDLNSKLWSAAIYPIAVFAVLILVAVGMLLWVFPTLLTLLDQGGQGAASLPTPTRVLLFLQTFLVNYWWSLILGAVVFYGIFIAYVGSEYGLQRWHYFQLRFPVVGGLLRRVYTLRFVDLLGILVDAGVPVLQALTITANSIQNRIYRLKIQEVVEGVKAGGRISTNLSDSEFLFAPEVVQMLNVGEASASLGRISEKISDQYDREIDASLKRLTSVFEPFMILFVGLFVALLALAIMAPIFNLGAVLGG